jgi:DNA-binding NtrC family response regulator
LRRFRRASENTHAHQEKAMPETSILIVGPPSELRDRYELSVRRHQREVVICENFGSAHVELVGADVRAVIVVSSADPPKIEEFLASVRGEHPHVPVFFVGASDSESIRGLAFQLGTVVLPRDMPGSQLEQVLFPSPPRPDRTSGEMPGEAEAVMVEHREYPLDFAQARALFEQEFLTQALKRERGNVSRTAQTIGIARRNLQIKIRVYGIDIARIRRER